MVNHNAYQNNKSSSWYTLDTQTINNLESIDYLVVSRINGKGDLKNKINELNREELKSSSKAQSAMSYLSEKKRELEIVASQSDDLSIQLEKILLSAEQPRAQLPTYMYGIPTDSKYLGFVIDTSGSMKMIWMEVLSKVENILKNYPDLKGFQIFSDQGEMLFSDNGARWMPPDKYHRDRAIRKLRTWNAYSNSSPVEGITIATQTLYQEGIDMAIMVLGDDYPGNDFESFLYKIRQVTDRETNSSNRFRIHALGFSNEGNVGYPDRFAQLMQRLTFQNGGAYLHVATKKPRRVKISADMITPGLPAAR